MTTSMVAVSASTRNAHMTLSEPDWIQLNTGTTLCSAWPPRNEMKIGQLSRQDRNKAPRDDLGRHVADKAIAQAGDDGGEQRAEDDDRNEMHVGALSPSSG